jgi:hypothetical protein
VNHISVEGVLSREFNKFLFRGLRKSALIFDSNQKVCIIFWYCFITRDKCPCGISMQSEKRGVI